MNEESTILPPDTRRVIISVNPKAGRRTATGRIERLKELLREENLQPEVFTDLVEVSERANELHAAGELRALVGVGGDGTAAELVNRTNEGVPVTLMAAGTANLLSKYFRLTGKPEKVCRTIAAGHLRRLDAGLASGRLFLVMVSCGFDAEVVQRVHTHRNNCPRGAHISYLSYLKPILGAIRSYDYPEFQIYCDSSENGSPGPPSDEPVTARWAFAFNLPCYGWGLPLAPKAVGTDGILDVCTFGTGSLLAGMRYVVGAQLGGWHQRMSDCQMLRGKRFRIESEHPITYQLDGDPGGTLPVDIEILPNRLTLVVPPGKNVK